MTAGRPGECPESVRGSVTTVELIPTEDSHVTRSASSIGPHRQLPRWVRERLRAFKGDKVV